MSFKRPRRALGFKRRSLSHSEVNLLRVTSLNVNGLRSAFRKGLPQWLDSHQPDVVCLQEIKAHEADLDAALRAPVNYGGHFHCAEKKGYSGVGLYTRHAPVKVESGIGLEDFDREGRLISATWQTRKEFHYLRYYRNQHSKVEKQHLF